MSEENKIGIPIDFSVNPEPITRSAFMADVYDWNTVMLNLPEIHNKYRGEGQKIGILDTGFMIGHADLDDQIERKSFVDEDEIDKNGHSTHVRGIINAQQNGKGLIGVAPAAKVACAKVLKNDGFGNMKSLADGIDWLVSIGCTVINGSLSSPNPDSRVQAALKRAYDAGVVLVFASGNNTDNKVRFPASDSHVISVGAIDVKKILAKFSNTGVKLKLVAPGVQIKSTWIDGEYRNASGTSMATPHVAGVCALVQEYFRKKNGRNASPDELFDILQKSAEDLSTKGRDNNTGHGLVTTSSISQADGPDLPAPNDPKDPAAPNDPPPGGCAEPVLALVLLIVATVILI